MSVDQYLKQLSSEQIEQYERIKRLVSLVTPDAEEVMSYGVPTFEYKGKILLHFGAFKNHMSLFPGSEATQQFAKRLKDYEVSKGTIRFTSDKPLPDDLVKDIVAMRYEQISGILSE